ncbi:MAG: NTP transferase domain-containing protein [Armatimonadota bacterium]
MAKSRAERPEREPIDVVVLAGGRISGWFRRSAGTSVKALAPVAGEAVVRRTVRGLRESRWVREVCVVGPEPLREAVADLALWQADAGSALANAIAGLEKLGGDATRRVLVSASDHPFLNGAAVDDYLDRSPTGAAVTMPLVRRERFVERFPGNWGVYVRLAEGRFTSGGQFLFRPDPVLQNPPLLQSLFNRRKSQLALASMLGWGLVWKLVRGRLSIDDVEQRMSEITGCACRAVPDCHPELAYDMDNVLDLRDAEQRLLNERRAGS